MRDYLIELFKQLNETFPPEVNEYGRTVRHNITFDTDTQELCLTLSVFINGEYRWLTFELDYMDLEDPIYKLIEEINKLLENVKAT
jgi:hypothetical protein